MSHPQIIDSLLANKIFLLIFINCKVGFKPDYPVIAEIVMSIFFFFLGISKKLFKMLIFFFLNFLTIFK